MRAESLTLPLTRTFYDVDTRPLTGELLKVREDQIYLKRDVDGAHFWVPINRLSEKDQVWLRENFLTQESESVEALEWPDRAEPSESINIEIVEETYKDGIFIYASDHFQYESPGRLSRTLVRDFAEVFEATYSAVMMMPLPWRELPPNEPMRVLIFDSMVEYVAAGGLPNSAGVYIYQNHTCLVPVSSLGLARTSTGYRKEGEADFRILLHEVTHQVMHRWRLPIWLIEGMAEYLERQPYKDGIIYFRRFDAAEVLKDLQPRIQSGGLVHPDTLLNMSHREWNSAFLRGDTNGLLRNYLSAFVMTAFFLHLSDEESAVNLHRFVSGVLDGDEGAERYLSMHSSNLDLETRVYRALRRVGIQPEFRE